MSTIMQENGIIVGEFAGCGVTYHYNGDLRQQLRKGGNDMGSGMREEAVLVKLNVDDCEYNVVEVLTSPGRGTDVDAINAAIVSLTLARDTLLSMSAATA